MYETKAGKSRPLPEGVNSDGKTFSYLRKLKQPRRDETPDADAKKAQESVGLIGAAKKVTKRRTARKPSVIPRTTGMNTRPTLLSSFGLKPQNEMTGMKIHLY